MSKSTFSRTVDVEVHLAENHTITRTSEVTTKIAKEEQPRLKNSENLKYHSYYLGGPRREQGRAKEARESQHSWEHPGN